MKNIIVLSLVFFLNLSLFSQGRNINKLTLETTYSYVEIHKSLRDLVDAGRREAYFNDEFFNEMLKKVLLDQQFSAKEKVQIFYLMQKKIGYAFVGVSYIPPKQNYFVFHLGKAQVMKKTKDQLSSLNLDPGIYIDIADLHQTNDPIISSNALLLATLLNSEKTVPKLQKYSESNTIFNSKNPSIFNHYLCLCASIINDTLVQSNLEKNLLLFKQEGMIEDVFCALYSKPGTPVVNIKNYILSEKNPENDLAIQTGLCALYNKVSENAFNQVVKSTLKSVKEPWKKTILNDIAENKILFNYSLSSEMLVVPKAWDYVQLSIYNDGTLISNNTLLEFDPN